METWLSDSISDAELGLENFNIFRCDRIAADLFRGGGVLIADRDCFPSIMKKKSISNLEFMFVEFRLDHKHTVVGAIYIPPSSAVDICESHCLAINDVILESRDADFIITGDFNLPHFSFSNDKDGILFYNNDQPCNMTGQANILMNYFNEFNLYQHNSVRNATENTLDLIFSNLSGLSVRLALDPLIDCDKYHPALEVVLSKSFHAHFDRISTVKRNFKRADYARINEYLSEIPWDVKLEDRCIEDAVNFFYGHLDYVIFSFVPTYRLRRCEFPSWFSMELISLTIEKKKTHHKYKIFKSYLDYLSFADLRSRCKTLSRRNWTDYLRNTGSAISQNVKIF